MIDFPKKKYSVIYADPPWAPDNKGVQGAASKKYNVMKIEDICNLPVKDIAADDSLLFMWWLASMPLEALKVVEAWGFKFKTMTCFSFLKETSTQPSRSSSIQGRKTGKFVKVKDFAKEVDLK